MGTTLGSVPSFPPSQRKEDEDELSHADKEEASMLSEFADDAHGEGEGIVGEKSCEDYSKIR